LTDKRYDEASEHFTAAINADVLSYEQVTHAKYEVFIIVRSYNSADDASHANYVLV